jgi:hypothetical protein
MGANEYNKGFIHGVVLLVITAVFVSLMFFCLNRTIEIQMLRAQARQLGYARIDDVTHEWVWNVPAMQSP